MKKKLMSILFLTKSQNGQNEVKTQDKNVRNLNFIKSDATKIKSLLKVNI